MFKSREASFAGFRDIFGRDARTYSYLSSLLAELFQLWGYEQIRLSLIENIESFSEKIVGGSPWPEWNSKCSFCLNIEDYQNSYTDMPISIRALLVPEGTISVSRWLANQVGEIGDRSKLLFPLKVFYVVPCFRNEPIRNLSSAKQRSFTQAGIEIIGASNKYADLETMLLIAEGIKTIRIPSENISIRIGDIRIFNYLCKESRISGDDVIVLKEALDAMAESRAGDDLLRLKNETNNAKNILTRYGINGALQKKWELCFSGWRDQISYKELEMIRDCTESVSDLNYINTQLRRHGINSKIDLSVVRSHEYYTGIVYEVDAKVNGKTIIEIAGGGRYNKLIGHFIDDKISVPAIGFAYGLERMDAIFGQTQDTVRVQHWLSDKSADVVVYGGEEKFFGALNYARQARANHLRSDVYVGDSLSEEAARCYSETKGIKMEVIL